MTRKQMDISKCCIAGLMTAVLLFAVEIPGNAQDNADSVELPDPKVALLKSIAMPGWGHYYADGEDWKRGKYHLAGEVAMLISYVGLRIRSDDLESDLYTYARAEADVNLRNRDRSFRLAVGNFNNLKAYNDFHLRTRNWNKLLSDNSENQWHWDTDEDRRQYTNLRERVERIENQLPALISLMIVNRVVSGVSAYMKARDIIAQEPKVGFNMSSTGATGTVKARISIPF